DQCTANAPGLTVRTRQGEPASRSVPLQNTSPVPRRNNPSRLQDMRPPLRGAWCHTVRLMAENLHGQMSTRRSEHVFRMLAAANIAVWECDLVTGNVALTGDVEAMFGRPNESFDGTLRGFLEFIHPEDHVRLTQAVEVALGRSGLYEV